MGACYHQVCVLVDCILLFGYFGFVPIEEECGIGMGLLFVALAGGGFGRIQMQSGQQHCERVEGGLSGNPPYMFVGIERWTFY